MDELELTLSLVPCRLSICARLYSQDWEII